jgi:putative intracellular protease/amidase
MASGRFLQKAITRRHQPRIDRLPPIHQPALRHSGGPKGIPTARAGAVVLTSPPRTARETEKADMKILMVLTSHDELGDTGRATGFWLEELAAPYYVFKDAGAEIILASPKGGQPPLDPKSNEPASQTDATRRFEADAAAMAQLADTLRLDAVSQADYDTVFYPGGHGPLWDLAEDPDSIALIESFIAVDKPVALVCHAPGALRHVRKADGAPLVLGKRVTGFTDGEEEAVGLTKIVPFLVEDELKALGAKFEKTAYWGVHVVQDGLLITGQNPASSGLAATKLLAALAT